MIFHDWRFFTIPTDPVPVYLYTKEDFDSFVVNAPSYPENQLVVLGATIDLGGTLYNGIDYKGNFNGNGFEITNFQTNTGLFETIYPGKIFANLTLRDFEMDVGDYKKAGGLVKKTGGTEDALCLIQNIQVRNVRVTGTIKDQSSILSGEYFCGCIAGVLHYTTMVYCSVRDVNADENCSTHFGILTGNAEHSDIHDCYSVGSVVALVNRGGIAAWATYGSQVMHCWCTMSKTSGAADGTSKDTENFTSVSEYTMSFEFNTSWFSAWYWNIQDGTATDFIPFMVEYTFK